MSSSKTIAKNTLFLYFRMLFAMIVTLYTSRIILKSLGVEDFGLYSLIASVVVLFSFLNNALTSSTQRFLNFVLVKNDMTEINKVFCVSLKAHFFIALLILFIGETLGLWLVNSKLIISQERIYAANVVYQLSLLTTIVSVMCIPFNAMIIAKEKMSFYAILGILEVVLKLSVVYIIYFFGNDKLITYSVLLFLVSIIICFFYILYNFISFKSETALKYYNDKNLLIQIFSFSGWTLTGSLSSVLSNQGLAFIFNLFFGVVINATLGIATQVNNAVYSFVSNLQVAFSPRITQSYACNDVDYHIKLVLQASRLSFLLLILIVGPFFLYTEYVLNLWLTEVPQYTVSFVRIFLLLVIIDALSGPFWVSANAIGSIRNYQLGVSVILLLSLPIIYILLKFNIDPVIAMSFRIIVSVLCLSFRFLYIKKKLLIKRESFVPYLKSIFLVTLLLLLNWYLFSYLHAQVGNIYDFLKYAILFDVVLIGVILLVGVNKNEFNFVKNKIFK